jgi:hypothetical protein
MAGNIPHGLAASLLAQAGLRQRYGALATAALLVGSALPDLDALFELGSPISGFVHHRGITHSLMGGAGLALLGAALLWSVWRAHPYWRVTWLVYLSEPCDAAPKAWRGRKTDSRGLDNSGNIEGNPKAFFVPPSWPHAAGGGHPSPAALVAAPSAPPQPVGAARSTAERGAARLWLVLDMRLRMG